MVFGQHTREGTMFDWLVEIPGPQFLVIFPIFVAGTLLIVLGMYRLTEGKVDETVAIPRLNPLELAILSGGETGAVELGYFELYRTGSLSFDHLNRVILERPPESMQSGLFPIGEILYKEASKQQFLHQLLNGGKKYSERKKYLELVTKKLQSLNLVNISEIPTRQKQIYQAGMVVWLLFGGAKLFFGIARSKPVGFLILELIIAFVLYKKIAAPKPERLTALGRHVLKNIRQPLKSGMRTFIEYGQTSEIQSVLLMAAFGVTAFGQVPLVSPFTTALSTSAPISSSATSTSGSHGGCGYSATSGCSSGSSEGGCGSGGCSGGGCSGGGCGGCGGGGCGGCGE